MLSEPHLFVFGLGYVGLRLGQAAADLGYRVSGSCRTREKAVELQHSNMPIEAHFFDLDESYTGLDHAGLASLAQATHVIGTVPPVADFDRDPLLALHRDTLLQAAGSPLQWLGYLSTTSVYGDHDGAWVDEQTSPRVIAGSSAARRLAAELEWLEMRAASGDQLESRVFRLAGIYGPGRSALDTVARATSGPLAATYPLPDEATLDEAVARARAATRSPPRYVSRIHVDDICTALLASMSCSEGDAVVKQTHTDCIFNLADDEPTPREEVMAYAAAMLGAPQTAGTAANAAGNNGVRAQRRATEHKRVSNERMRATLLRDGLMYPTYRQGLRRIALGESE